MKKTLLFVFALLFLLTLTSCFPSNMQEGNASQNNSVGEELNESIPSRGYNETSEQGTFFEIKYQPMQCEKTPWQIWYEEGNIYFVKAPTQIELIMTYYDLVYNITLYNISEQHHEAVCMACSVCPSQTYYVAKVKEEDLARMLDLGWQRN